MSENPITVSPDTSVEQAYALLELGELHHLPVVDDGKLVGIVSTADLLKLYLLDEPVDAMDRIRVASIMAASARAGYSVVGMPPIRPAALRPGGVPIP